MLVATFKDRAGLVGDFWLAFRWTKPGYGTTEAEIHRDAFPDCEAASRWLSRMAEENGEADEYYIVYVHPANVEYLGVACLGFRFTPDADLYTFIDRGSEIRKAITAICDALCDKVYQHVTLLGDKKN